MTMSTPRSPDGKRESFFTTDIQDFCVSTFGPEDDHLRTLSQKARERGFPPIAISPMDGQVLRFLIHCAQAKNAAEIGSLGGYSGSWIARALQPDGVFHCFELDQERAAFSLEQIRIAAPNIRTVMHTGPAKDNLPKVTDTLDFVFIDADKENYPHYLSWAAERLRRGGIVAIDNSFAWGRLTYTPQSSSADPQPRDTQAIRSALVQLANDQRFSSAMIPTNEGLAVGYRL